MPPELEFKEAWKLKSYEWPVTSIPNAATVTDIGKVALSKGGRIKTESHADRAQTMKFPNEAIPGTSIKKQISRAECRRRAQITLPDGKEPMLVCVVCDAVHLWPKIAVAP